MTINGHNCNKKSTTLGVNSLFSLQAVKNDWRFTKMMGKVKITAFLTSY